MAEEKKPKGFEITADWLSKQPVAAKYKVETDKGVVGLTAYPRMAVVVIGGVETRVYPGHIIEGAKGQPVKEK